MQRLFNAVMMINRMLVFYMFVFVLASCSDDYKIKSMIQMEINHDWKFSQAGKEVWLPATVPGTVHTDLLANKIIEDPYYRLNEKQIQWIDKVDWEYRTVFIADGQVLEHNRIELIFKGLDTYAKIYLNGDLLQQTDNMFRTWKIDVTKKIRKGENKLSVILASPTQRGLEELKAYGFQLAADNDQSEAGEMGQDKVSPYVRKAPYHFGWDWGPRLVTSGIWRPVILRAWDEACLENIQIITDDLSTERAGLTAKIEIVAAEKLEITLNLFVDDISLSTRNWKLEIGNNLLEMPLTIDNPVLWQPNGLGSQKLYTIRIELADKEQVIDVMETKTGLRIVKLVRQPDPDGKGKSFYFKVNGNPVFAKGANYIPDDIFLNRVSPEKYEFIIKSAYEANMNMLRVWGGGIYENDLFYDLCDQYGIMVWQDFMFACAMYPGNEVFLENVRQEAIDNVRRLRNHPSIVLWCGNNEIENAWGEYEENRGWGWKQRYNPEQRQVIWKAYDTLFHHILPGVIEQEDPGRSYWHSSPSAGMGQLASYETTSGDMHYWGVWHGLHPFSDFCKYRARFMSEYGFQSFPEFNSVKKYTVPEDYNIESEVMMSHQRSGIGNLRIRQYMEEDYNIPGDFEQFLYVGQLLQAEAIKMAIESHRSDMPYCMGSLYWQINDCWPVASWSGIDYYGRWKALHYFAREAFKPTVLVLTESDGFLNGYVVSDNQPGQKMQVLMKLVSFTGKVEWEAVQEFEMTAQSILFLNSPLTEILGKIDLSSVVMVSELRQGDILLDTDFHYFVKPKNLDLTNPNIKAEIKEKGDLIEISLTAANLAKNVFLYGDGITGRFSDNYFDILPGQEVLVNISKSDVQSDLKSSLKILHLYLTDNDD
ncbi:MAG: glycoside hydrolase family 2 protein [Bacteroidales bacterium]|nr:glycoside hydrolase family 2 protein [Bacteroidales bacterium]